MDKSAKPASPRSGATLPGGCQVAKQSPTRLRDYHPPRQNHRTPGQIALQRKPAHPKVPGRSGENGQSMRQNCATKHRNGKPPGFREADLLESNKRDRRQMPRKDWKLLSRSKTRRFGVGGPSARGNAPRISVGAPAKDSRHAVSSWFGPTSCAGPFRPGASWRRPTVSARREAHLVICRDR
jgi:hypothetical protein